MYEAVRGTWVFRQLSAHGNGNTTLELERPLDSLSRFYIGRDSTEAMKAIERNSFFVIRRPRSIWRRLAYRLVGIR